MKPSKESSETGGSPGLDSLGDLCSPWLCDEEEREAEGQRRFWKSCPETFQA